MDIEKKIQEDVKKSIETQKKDKITPKIIKKELFAFAPELKNRMTFSIILACIGESLGFISYFFAAYVAVGLYNNSLDNKIWIYAALTLLVLALQKIFTYLSSVKSHDISFTILRNIRTEISKKLERVPLGYVISTPIGHYKALIVERVNSLEDWVAHSMPEFPSRMLHPILATIIIFILDYRLGIACFASIPFLILASLLMFYKREERMYTWLNANQNLNSRAVEYVNGINVIKAFNQSDKSYKQFSDAVNYYHDSTLNWWKSSWFSMAIMYAVFDAPIIGTLPVGTYLFMNGEISMFVFILGMILPLSIIPNLFPLLSTLELYSMIETSWRMIRKVMTLPELSRPDIKVNIDKNKCFEFNDVSFEYDEGIEVLHDLNFVVDNNSVFAIVGESGSGKSTIAKLMVSYFNVNKGEIKFGGHNINEIPINQLMEDVAYVAQDNFLFDTTLKENLKIAKPNASEDEINRAVKLANCEDLVARLPMGINSNAGDCGRLLSGGERQRLTLARAMLSDARCIILDEATAYADPENEAKIQNALSTLVKNKTLIIVAHRLHTIVKADKIAVLDKGRIVNIGKHDDLLKDCKVYKKLWENYAGKENL